jgi:hypothetical protein
VDEEKKQRRREEEEDDQLASHDGRDIIRITSFRTGGPARCGALYSTNRSARKNEQGRMKGLLPARSNALAKLRQSGPIPGGPRALPAWNENSKKLSLA